MSRDFAIVSHRHLPSFGSDHYPILAELALPGPREGVAAAVSQP